MGKSTDSNGATQGALVVVFGMILGALLLRVVERYTMLEKQKALSEIHKFYGNTKA